MAGEAQRKTRTRGVSPERIAAVADALGERARGLRLLPGGRAEFVLTGGDVVPLSGAREEAPDAWPAPRTADAP